MLNIIIDIIEKNILEKEPHKELYDELSNLLKNIDNDENIFLSHYIRLEIELLRILGYGIDLSRCAVTGQKNDLYFVSPKSGRAVSKEVGEKYRNKLLKLPSFLTKDASNNVDKGELLSGLKLSGFFIAKYLYPQQAFELQNSRNRLLEYI